MDVPILHSKKITNFTKTEKVIYKPTSINGIAIKINLLFVSPLKKGCILNCA